MIHYARCNVLINTRFNAIENNRKKQFFEIPDYQQLLLVKLILDIFKLILKESNVIESLETTHEKLIKERSKELKENLITLANPFIKNKAIENLLNETLTLIH